MVSRCKFITAHEVSNVITSAHMTHNPIDWVLVRHVSEMFCVTQSSDFVDFVVSFVDWFLWRESEMWLCVFCLWLQCSTVERDSIPNYVFIECTCRGRYFDYQKRPCLQRRERFVRLSRQTVSRKCRHWWPGKIALLSCESKERCISNFPIIVVLKISIARLHSFVCVVTRCGYIM